MHVLGHDVRWRHELEHVHEELEQGDAPETPVIALAEVLLFLVPVVAVILGIAFAAYYLAG
jgi:hypothetical protein